MKLHLYTALTLLLITGVLADVGADPALNVQSREPVYALGDEFKILGSAQPVRPSSDAVIIVYRPDGGRWAMDQVRLDPQGRFETTVARLGPSDQLGSYRAVVSYGGESASVIVNVTKAWPFAVTAAGESFTVMVKTVSDVTDFVFSQSGMRLSFTAQGGGRDYAYVTVPQRLLSGNITWMAGSQTISTKTYSVNASHTGYWISYTRPAQITMTGTRVIPEFPPLGILLAFIVVLMAVAFASKGLLRRHTLSSLQLKTLPTPTDGLPEG